MRVGRSETDPVPRRHIGLRAPAALPEQQSDAHDRALGRSVARVNRFMTHPGVPMYLSRDENRSCLKVSSLMKRLRFSIELVWKVLYCVACNMLYMYAATDTGIRVRVTVFVSGYGRYGGCYVRIWYVCDSHCHGKRAQDRVRSW